MEIRLFIFGETNKHYQPSGRTSTSSTSSSRPHHRCPRPKRFAVAKLTLGHHDLYGVEIETKDPYPIIGHVHFKRPVLEGSSRYRTA